MHRDWSLTIWRDGGGVVEWRARDRELDKQVTRRREFAVSPERLDELLERARLSGFFGSHHSFGGDVPDSSERSLWMCRDPKSVATIRIAYLGPNWKDELASDPYTRDLVEPALNLWESVEGFLPDVEGVEFVK